jgi:hypothetical protein
MSTTRPLEPTAYLKVARELAGKDGEEYLRTAIGRLYYCCFLIARQRTGVTATKDVHRIVITTVRGRAGYWGVADQLDNLRRLRVAADYQLVPTDPRRRDWHRNWARAESIANTILPQLQAL